MSQNNLFIDYSNVTKYCPHTWLFYLLNLFYSGVILRDYFHQSLIYKNSHVCTL